MLRPTTKAKRQCTLFLALGVAVAQAYAVDPPAYQLDDDSMLLVKCESTFAYGVNYFLMLDKPGAAKIMALQQARATTALFALHYENGSIPGHKVHVFKEEGRKFKPVFDEDPAAFLQTVDECTPAVTRIIDTTNVRAVRMWGKSFGEIVEELAGRIRGVVGLN